MNGDTSFKRSRAVHPPRWWWRRARRNWPFALWIVVLLFVAVSYTRNQQFGRMTGTVETIEEPVAPLETARLVSVNVRPGQPVNAGDIMARMDTSLIDAEIAVREAELVEAQETITTYQRDMLRLKTQYEDAVKDAQQGLETVRTDQKRDSDHLKALRAEMKRLEDLRTKRLVGESDLVVIRLQIATLEGVLAGYPALVEIAERRLNDALKDLDDAKQWLRATEGEATADAIRAKMQARNAIIQANREMLEQRKKTYALRATRDSVVWRILLQPGVVVNAGSPVMLLAAEHSAYIIGFLPEVHVADLTPGDKVVAWRQNRKGSAAFGIVESISPVVEAGPGRFSPIQGQVLRGRRVMIKIEGPHAFIPGETVEIQEIHGGLFGLIDRFGLFVRRLVGVGVPKRSQAQAVAEPSAERPARSE